MKKIKFRGKDIFTKEWRYGDLTHSKVISTELKEVLYSQIMVDGYEVDEKTVGQLINDTYSNAGEIYEGDILRITDEDNDDTWITKVCVDGEVMVDGYDSDYISLSYINDLGYNVIGNIYDNPELLSKYKYIKI